MPFGGYKDFAACVAANRGKADPAAYCGAIKHRTEDVGKTLADVLKGDWDESAHPRHPAGSPQGGEFARKVSRKLTGRPDPATMSAAEVNRELERLRELDHELNDRLITAGRGSERPSDRRDLTDPLSRAERHIFDRQAQLRNEITARMGPGYYSMAPGFKRRRPKAPGKISQLIDLLGSTTDDLDIL